MSRRLLSVELLHLGVLFAVEPGAAQRLDRRVPQDTTVPSGKLANGLTYYIRRNAEPPNRAELRRVVNAGSLL